MRFVWARHLKEAVKRVKVLDVFDVLNIFEVDKLVMLAVQIQEPTMALLAAEVSIVYAKRVQTRYDTVGALLTPHLGRGCLGLRRLSACPQRWHRLQAQRQPSASAQGRVAWDQQSNQDGCSLGLRVSPGQHQCKPRSGIWNESL